VRIRKRKRQARKDPKKEQIRLLNSFNNITQETTQLIEIKDIKDELGMLIKVLKAQQSTIEAFSMMAPPGTVRKEVLSRTVEKGAEQLNRLEQMLHQSEEIFNAVRLRDFLHNFSLIKLIPLFTAQSSLGLEAETGKCS
jgi:hypothetical protein